MLKHVRHFESCSWTFLEYQNPNNDEGKISAYSEVDSPLNFRFQQRCFDVGDQDGGSRSSHHATAFDSTSVVPVSHSER